MRTYQDFKASVNKEDFISMTIQEFLGSDFYNKALVSRAYFEGANEVLNRKPYFYNSQGIMEEDIFKANNTVSNNYYKKIVLQEIAYLLSNGIMLESKFDKKIKKLDDKVENATLSRLLDGRSYVYVYRDKNNRFKLEVFKGIEFIPLYDEKTGDVMAGIRFYQLDPSKPTYIELYEVDGITEYTQINGGKPTITQDKRPYSLVKESDILGTRVVGGKNWSELPVIEMRSKGYIANNRLTVSLKTKIDLYDIILSDFGNNLEDTKDVYWVLKNYQGQDMGKFIEDYKYYKAIRTDDDGEATAQTIEVPFQAREIALKILRERIYDEAMAVDMSILSGGSLTNVAIKAAFADLDMKADILEKEIIEVIDDVLEFYEEFTGNMGVDVDNDYTIDLVRNRIVDEEGLINTLVSAVGAGILSIETALKKNPFVDDYKEELKILNEETQSFVSEAPPIQGEG